MLSILIPIYNFDIRKLVNDLHSQCLRSKIDFELICLDDGSKNEFKLINREVTVLPNVIYEELKVNLGRSKIRNQLGQMARFDYLIFMDCDSKVVSESYISNYLKVHKSETFKIKDFSKALIYGGRCYQSKSPENPNHLFHWTYGISREQNTPNERQKKPYHSFMTNNFWVPKKVFLEIKFDETLTQYGHEDTLFGLELMKRKIPIIHIDNPLEHIGLEDADVFLDKSKKAIQNLYYLSKKNDLIETKLLKYYHHLKRFGLAKVMGMGFDIFEPFLLKNLKSNHPNLKLFDIYKLGYLCKIASK